MTRQYAGPVLTTDIIIQYKGGIVLIRRGNDPDKGKLALPGGFAEKGLTLEQNAMKESKEETGLEVVLETKIQTPEKPFLVKSHPLRDPRGHMVSVTYIAIGSGTLKAGDDAKEAAVYTYDEVERLLGKNLFAFDHEAIIKEYLPMARCLAMDEEYSRRGW